MKITKEQTATSALAGETKDGKPVAYVLSKGGLHCFFIQGEKGPEALAAAPHIAIARHFAEKKSGGIKWTEDYMWKSTPDYKKLWDMFWLKQDQVDLIKSELPKDEDALVVLKTKEPRSFHIIEKAELVEGIKSGEYDRFDMIRPLDLSKKEIFIEDSEFKDLLK